MNKEEIDIWLKYFANRPVGYQMYDENEVKRKFNLFDIFQYIKLLQQKIIQLEKQIEHYKSKEIERINKDLLQAENDYLERCIKANISGDING